MATSKAKHLTGANFIPLVFSIVIGLAIWLVPTPQGLEKNAWQMFAIFVATIIGIMTKALPMGGMALLALTTLTVTETLPFKDVLSGFSNSIVWLVVMAFMVAKSFVKTGLGFRIAYHLVSVFGKKSLGLAYGMAFTDLVLAPAIPSNSARGGGIIYPIIKSLAITFESTPEKKTERRIGAFLIKTAYQANIITSAMFLTAMAANPMMAEMAEEMGIKVSWGKWALAAAVPGIVSIILIPWLIYKLYPPEIKETPQAKQIAQEHLKKMGKMKSAEWITLGVFILMLCLWVFGGMYIFIFDPDTFTIKDVMLIKAESTTTAMIGVSILLLTGVLDWKDVSEEEQAWNTFFWFSTLLMMAAALSKLGFIGWISNSIQDSVTEVNWIITYVLLILGFFYSHYFFASSTAHASSMFVALTVVGVTAGAPPLMMALSLAFISNLSACLTHYGTAPGPIFFGSGYVDLSTWWKLGAIISIFHLVIWIGLGPMWWKVIGIW